MPLSSSKAWLERALTNDGLSAEELGQLVIDCAAERQHVEYKAGAELKKGAEQASKTLRKYVAGFSNSDGGLAIFGYNEGKQRFDGVEPFGHMKPEHWAARVLSGMAPQLSPPPRIFETIVKGETVLSVATYRAPRAILIEWDGQPTYFLRIGDSTVPAPAYLVSDLLLGRRRAPSLHLSLRAPTFQGQPRPFVPSVSNCMAGSIRLNFLVENASLVHAEEVRVGVVTWSAWGPNTSMPSAPTGSLLSYVDQLTPERNPNQVDQAPWLLAHLPTTLFAASIRPLEMGSGGVDLQVPMFSNLRGSEEPLAVSANPSQEEEVRALMDEHSGPAQRGWIRLESAVYALARDSEPTFYQLELVYKGSGSVVSSRLEPPTWRPRVTARFVKLSEAT